MTDREWRLRTRALAARWDENRRGFLDLNAVMDEGVAVTPELRARFWRLVGDLDRIIEALERHHAARPDDA